MEAAAAPFEDDDFGELYADIQLPYPTLDFPNQPQPEPEPEEEQPQPNTNSPNLNHNAHHSLSSEPKDDCAMSDSDDDLKIVLNDDDDDDDGDCAHFHVAAGNGGHDDEDADGGDHRSPDCDELVIKNNELKGGCGARFSHHKYMRTQGGSMFGNNMRANKSMEMASYISSLHKSRWNGDAYHALNSCHVNRMYSAGNPMVAQCGFGSFLPWHWNIFDVNIDTLEAKPWRFPGADITDYFNFDFNENTWNLYRASLEQLWRTSVQTGSPVDGSMKLNQETTREQIDQVVSGSVVCPPSDCELPKGRAILVEDSMVERQPSMDVKRPRSRDSDVIIQIKVLESSDDCSGSGNSTVMDVSLEGESAVGNNRNILNSSSGHDDVLSEVQLEDVKKSEDSSFLERSGLIPGVEENKHQDQVDQLSEDAQVLEAEIKVEKGIGVGTCSADPCWIESELSLGDQELSLTSCTDSDSEATENSVHDDNEKGHSPLRRKSVNSITDLKESLPLYSKNSKIDSFNRRPVNVAYCSRNRGPLRKEWRHESGRRNPGSNLNRHVENGMCGARDLPLLGHQFDHYDRSQERLLDFGSRKRRDVSYNRETKQSCYYDGERFVDDLVQTVRTEYSYWEDRESFHKNTNRYDRRNVAERNYFFEPRSPTEYSEDRERGCYHADWEYSADDLSPHYYRESRQFVPKHSSFPAMVRDSQRRRTNDKSHFGNRNYNDDFDEYEFDFLTKSYLMSTSAAEREMDYLDNKHEEQFPHIDRDWKRSDRMGRHHDKSPLVLDNLYGKMEDKCSKYTHHKTPNYRFYSQFSKDSDRNCVHDTRVNKNFGDFRRHGHATENRGSDWPYGYADVTEDEDFITSPEEEYQFYRSLPEALHFTEDETIYRHHETHVVSLRTALQINDRKMRHHHLNMPMRGSENCLKGSSKMMCRGKWGQAVQRCKKSVDFVNGEGKSHARSSGVLCNGRLGNVGQVIAKKRKAIVSFDESHKKVIKYDTSKSEYNHGDKKRVQTLPDAKQEEDLDIEEGQIVTEEPYTKASVSRRDISEGAKTTDSAKSRMSLNDSNSAKSIGGYDSQRILDSLAKMEKRRERFKQPITMKSEAEESLKLNNDSIIDTGEIKQHRPARKRRWIGS